MEETNMNDIIEVDNNSEDFYKLCKCLEKEHIDVIKEQRRPNGNSLKNLDKFTTIYIQYINNDPVACIAMKKCLNGVVEIGRVYVKPEFRRSHIATKLFQKVEQHAKELGANKLALDTYERFSSAVNLYKKLGFYEINNYFEDSPYSICMEKKI